MSITRPYYRLWRPLKGYEGDLTNLIHNAWGNNEKKLSDDYLSDDRYITTLEMKSLVLAAHLIIRDLYEIFNYVEPCDLNNRVYSHRIYELLLRTATEFENNCKGILKANNYNRSTENLNITDYFKIAAVAKLSDYAVVFDRWTTTHEFKPFAEWSNTEYNPLSWYRDYNCVKHNRFANFDKANLENLMNAVAAVLCIMHAQFGNNMAESCFERITPIQNEIERVETGTFIIKIPHFSDAEQYDFIWDDIKSESNPFQFYNFG